MPAIHTSRTSLLKLNPALFCALFCALSACLAAASAARPNFVFFLTDDQPYNGMGCMGNPVIKTPNMDRLAAEGVLFERAFVTTSICCSSRASIYTGQHMRRHGIEDFKKPLSAAQWQQTFPALLRQSGYRTAFLGKFAIGAPDVSPELSLPADQFDLWYGFPQNFTYRQIVDGQPRYLTTVMTEKALQFLKETRPDQPFCLVMAFKEPHGKLDYFDPEFEDPYPNATIRPPASHTRESFAALPERVQSGLNGSPQWLGNPTGYEAALRESYAYISRSDFSIGQICRALKDQGLDQNTVVIHLSDNGDMDGAHGLDGKWMMYEESIQVPLIIRDPRLPAATHGRRSQVALNIDVAPTILAMAGLPVPAGMQGVDLQPVLRDPDTKGREDWYYEHVFTAKGLRKPIPKSEGVRTERWKYIRYTEAPVLEQLFDLAGDPQEEHDLAGNLEHAATLAKLRARCDEYRETLR